MMKVRLPIIAATLIVPIAAGAQTPSASAAVFAPCKACHVIQRGAAHTVGPNLYGVVGRKAGSAAGYNYSPAMKGYGKTWTAAALDAYLTSPRLVVPGTKMTYAGMKDPSKRAAVVAYLQGK